MTKLYVCEISNLIQEVSKDEKSLEIYFEKLGKARIEHILKNNRAEDRARSLGAALLLLFALRKNGFEPERLPDFDYIENGKPYFREFEKLHFNLSHTKNMVTCVISDEEVGVDIEHTREIKEATIKRVFTEDEKKMAGEKPEGYVKLWTMKEACAKLCGKGLSDILDGLEIVKEQNTIKIRKLNQDIRKTSCYYVIAEGKLLDSMDYPYYYSVCAKKETSVETFFTKWDNAQIKE